VLLIVGFYRLVNEFGVQIPLEIQIAQQAKLEKSRAEDAGPVTVAFKPSICLASGFPYQYEPVCPEIVPEF
jgi:hypothetical protein